MLLGLLKSIAKIPYVCRPPIVAGHAETTLHTLLADPGRLAVAVGFDSVPAGFNDACCGDFSSAFSFFSPCF